MKGGALGRTDAEMTAVAKIEPTRILRNNVIRDGAKFSKPCLCWHEILSQRLLRERTAAIQICVTAVALRWRTRGFGLLQSLSLYSRGTSRSVSPLQSGILTIRIFAYVRGIHAPRLASFQPVEFRLHSRTRHRNFYSQNHAYIVGLIRGGEAYCGDGTRKF